MKVSQTQWTNHEVLALITEVSKKKMNLMKCEVWNQISEEMIGDGFHKSSAMCGKKWNNLKIRYY